MHIVQSREALYPGFLAPAHRPTYSHCSNLESSAIHSSGEHREIEEHLDPDLAGPSSFYRCNNTAHAGHCGSWDTVRERVEGRSLPTCATRATRAFDERCGVYGVAGRRKGRAPHRRRGPLVVELFAADVFVAYDDVGREQGRARGQANERQAKCSERGGGSGRSLPEQ